MFDGTLRGKIGFYIQASSNTLSNNLQTGKMGFSITTTGDAITGGSHYGYDDLRWFFNKVEMYGLYAGLDIDNMSASQCRDLSNWTYVASLSRI